MDVGVLLCGGQRIEVSDDDLRPRLDRQSRRGEPDARCTAFIRSIFMHTVLKDLPPTGDEDDFVLNGLESIRGDFDFRHVGVTKRGKAGDA